MVQWMSQPLPLRRAKHLHQIRSFGEDRRSILGHVHTRVHWLQEARTATYAAKYSWGMQTTRFPSPCTANRSTENVIFPYWLRPQQHMRKVAQTACLAYWPQVDAMSTRPHNCPTTAQHSLPVANNYKGLTVSLNSLSLPTSNGCYTKGSAVCC